MEHVVMVRFSEIHLKGQNRPYFEKLLAKRLKEAVSPFEGASVEKGESRYLIRGVSGNRRAMQRIGRVFGVHSYVDAIETDKDDFQALCRAAHKMLEEEYEGGGTFKVIARRGDKRYPMNSQQIAAKMGEYILEHDEAGKWNVDIHKPQASVHVEIRDKAYIYCHVQMGHGGMPVGSGGKALVMLSGGIDSPVAAYMMAKRGVALEAVHFFSPPYTSERAKRKVVDLTKILTEYCGHIRLHIIGFTDIQQAIYQHCPQKELTVLMRRSMMRIAGRIAQAGRSQALITGESLGQVASQTMEALAVTNAAAQLPVLRPLVGFDKIDIMELAQKIGTYDTSILPFEDCCTVFVPRHPVTKPVLSRIERSEMNVNFASMEDAAVQAAEIVDVRAD